MTTFEKKLDQLFDIDISEEVQKIDVINEDINESAKKYLNQLVAEIIKKFKSNIDTWVAELIDKDIISKLDSYREKLINKLSTILQKIGKYVQKFSAQPAVESVGKSNNVIAEEVDVGTLLVGLLGFGVLSPILVLGLFYTIKRVISGDIGVIDLVANSIDIASKSIDKSITYFKTKAQQYKERQEADKKSKEALAKVKSEHEKRMKEKQTPRLPKAPPSMIR